MRAPTSSSTRIAGFVLGLAVVLGLALGLGRAVGPVTQSTAAGHDGHDGHDQGHDSGTGSAGTGAPGSGGGTQGQQIPGGLMVSQGGYTLLLASRTARAGDDVSVTFTVTGPDGKPVTGYDVQHEKLLHFIAVRRDNTGFQHVHPTLATDGTWSTKLDLEPGAWRVFADFKATGAPALTLGADLDVPGQYEPAAPVGQVRTAEVDGYTVTLAGDLTAGKDARLTLNVTKDGKAVTDLQPYLGAYGHLVALREGDLAYLHVHPDGEPGDGRTKPGPEVVFHAGVPSSGDYRLYLDFQHIGVVRTAAFAITASGSAAGDMPSTSGTPSPGPAATTDAGHGGH